MGTVAIPIEETQAMKAVVRRRWGGPRDVVELAEIAKPEPADDEVLVRVHASSVNRSDYYALGGVAVLMRPMIGGFLRPKDGRVGGDFAGIAEAVGKDVDDVRPGDEVYGCRGGAFAETSRRRWRSPESRPISPSRRRRRSPSQR
jgi:NADPH:quinone reductase-like Zn-dependent oxidoreductase